MPQKSSLAVYATENPQILGLVKYFSLLAKFQPRESFAILFSFKLVVLPSDRKFDMHKTTSSR